MRPQALPRQRRQRLPHPLKRLVRQSIDIIINNYGGVI